MKQDGLMLLYQKTRHTALARIAHFCWRHDKGLPSGQSDSHLLEFGVYTGGGLRAWLAARQI